MDENIDNNKPNKTTETAETTETNIEINTPIEEVKEVKEVEPVKKVEKDFDIEELKRSIKHELMVELLPVDFRAYLTEKGVNPLGISTDGLKLMTELYNNQNKKDKEDEVLPIKGKKNTPTITPPPAEQQDKMVKRLDKLFGLGGKK